MTGNPRKGPSIASGFAQAGAYLADQLYGKPFPVTEANASGDTEFTLTRVIVDL